MTVKTIHSIRTPYHIRTVVMAVDEIVFVASQAPKNNHVTVRMVALTMKVLFCFILHVSGICEHEFADLDGWG